MANDKFYAILRSKTREEPLIIFSDLKEKGYLEEGELDFESDIEGLLVAKIYIGDPIFETVYEDISKWSKTQLMYLLKLIAEGSAEMKQLEYIPHELNVPDLSDDAKSLFEELMDKEMLDTEPR